MGGRKVVNGDGFGAPCFFIVVFVQGWKWEVEGFGAGERISMIRFFFFFLVYGFSNEFLGFI